MNLISQKVQINFNALISKQILCRYCMAEKSKMNKNRLKICCYLKNKGKCMIVRRHLRKTVPVFVTVRGKAVNLKFSSHFSSKVSQLYIRTVYSFMTKNVYLAVEQLQQ